MKTNERLKYLILPLSLALLHRLQLTEIARQQIEEELMIINKDKSEIIEQFQQVHS